MIVYHDPFPQIDEPFVASIGKFDGLHVGHRLIMDTLVDEGRRLQAASLVFSFEPPKHARLLTSREEKLNLFGSLGITYVVLAEFTESLKAMTAEQFVERLSACGELKAAAVGQDFHFGRGAAGDVSLLKNLGQKHGFRVHAIAQVESGGQTVSSTLIRECVKSGDVERAALLLGREYALSGEVVQGRRLARQLGYKTANLLPPPGKVIPAYGVYAAYVDSGAGSWPAMTNIGVKPTIEGSELMIESHLLGFDGDLYGKRITVRLVKKIRDEIRFDGLERLASQLNDDKKAVWSILGGGLYT